MGCDIHTVIEEKVDGRWIGVCASDRAKDRPMYARRDYDFFGEIANVRGRGKHYPKNLPRDVSELSWHLYMRSPTDHHSASHMGLDEFCAIYCEMNPAHVRTEHAVYDVTGIDVDQSNPFRVVFWFDN